VTCLIHTPFLYTKVSWSVGLRHLNNRCQGGFRDQFEYWWIPWIDVSQQITTLLYIKRACELNKSHIISTDEDPGLRIESFAVINLRGVSTNKTIIYLITMQTYKELIIIINWHLQYFCWGNNVLYLTLSTLQRIFRH
jgi:hypothetical protein